MRVPNKDIFKKFKHNYRESDLGSSKFLMSGHSVDPTKGWLAGYNSIKDNSWPNINCLQDWFELADHIKMECLDHKIYLSSAGGAENLASFCHQYFVTQHLSVDREYQSERTFQNMVSVKRMPYLTA
jgi:hypothetical protein